MKISLYADVAGVRRKMDLIIDSLQQVDKALKRFGKYMRLKVQRTFSNQGPGWSALNESTLKHRETHALGTLGKKLKRDVMRAEKKAKNQKTVERRLSVLAEFRRLEAGGRLDASLLPEKQAASLKSRIERAKKKSSERVLGRVASSIYAKVSAGTLEVGSQIPWAGVHNDGGTAGHGAPIPKREFLSIDAEDMEVLEGFLLDEIDAALAE